MMFDFTDKELMDLATRLTGSEALNVTALATSGEYAAGVVESEFPAGSVYIGRFSVECGVVGGCDATVNLSGLTTANGPGQVLTLCARINAVTLTGINLVERDVVFAEATFGSANAGAGGVQPTYSFVGKVIKLAV